MLQGIDQHIAISEAGLNVAPEGWPPRTSPPDFRHNVIKPDTNIGPCFQGLVVTTIDYCVVSNSLSHGLESIRDDLEPLTRPHWPASLTFHPCLTALKELTVLETTAFSGQGAARPQAAA